MDSGPHSSCRTPSARMRQGWEQGGEFLSQAWCFTNYDLNAMYVLNLVLLLESPFLPLACLIFFLHGPAQSPPCPSIQRPLLYCSFAYTAYLSMMTGGVGFWPGRGCGDHFGSASLMIQTYYRQGVP